MTEQALKALEQSIEHWAKLTAGVPGQKIGAHACPLCNVFNHQNMEWSDRCIGCPVSEKTRMFFCGGTPWDSIEDTIDQLNDREISEWLLTDEAKALAAEELAFLKSLLP